MDIITLKVIIRGRVQGVGYRWFARENAEDLNLTGRVQNLPDGNVEVLVQGEAQNVWDFTKLLRQGPSFSNVLDTEITELTDDQNFKSFEVSF